MTEWYDFPNVKSTKMLSFLFGSRGLQPDLPSPFGRKFLFCLVGGESGRSGPFTLGTGHRMMCCYQGRMRKSVGGKLGRPRSFTLGTGHRMDKKKER